jgi:hypothetical protein
MNNRKAKLLRRLTRAASPMTATPVEIRRVYRGIKNIYNAAPGPSRLALLHRLTFEARELQVVNAVKEAESS